MTELSSFFLAYKTAISLLIAPVFLNLMQKQSNCQRIMTQKKCINNTLTQWNNATKSGYFASMNNKIAYIKFACTRHNLYTWTYL